MRNESLETTFVMTCNPINAISTKRSTYATQTLFIYIRFIAELVNSAEIVAHTLAAVVPADLLVPCHAKTR